MLASSLLLNGCFRAMEPASGSQTVVDDVVASLSALAGQTPPEEASPAASEPAGVPATGSAPHVAVATTRDEVTPMGAALASDAPATVTLGAGLTASRVTLDGSGAVPPDWAEGAQPGSVRIAETAPVLAEPDPDSVALGLVEAGAHLAVVERVVAPGCPQAWLGVAPYGYVCAEFRESPREASGTLLPRIPAGRRIPGAYGRVNKGAQIYSTLAQARAGVGGRVPSASLMVRRLKTHKVDGTSFWKTRQGYIATKHIRRFSGATWHGIQLDESDAPTLPMAWARPEAMLAKVAVKAAPKRNAKVIRRLARRELVELVSGVVEHGHLQLRDGGYVEKARLAVATKQTRPDAAEADERWLDIDVSQQTLVAYAGDTPVYATLISSGRAGHSTPTGVFRLSRKVAERTMNSMADSDDSYSVAKVPWTAYFATGYALHAAYWHDNFGSRKSHGCVNLSPIDARALYAWTAPAVAPGWSEVYGHEAQPGSVIQIRSRRNPNPTTKGYAKAMLQPSETAPTLLAQR